MHVSIAKYNFYRTTLTPSKQNNFATSIREYKTNANETEKKISLIHQNVRSIGNSVDLIEDFLHEHQSCKFLCISEHWKTDDQLSDFAICDFNLAAKYCREEGEHGGVAVYVHKEINCKPRKKLTNLSVSKVFECAVAECSIGKNRLLLLAYIVRLMLVLKYFSRKWTNFYHRYLSKIK